jgi:membrane protein DedA with SNARE-associated domain
MYFYARAHGRRFLESGWPRRFMPPEAVATLEGAFARHGMLGVFVSRFLPAARAAVTPLAGVVGMPALRCLVPSAAASAIWYALLVGLGTFLGFSLESAKATLADLNRVLGAISAIAITAFVIWLVRRSRAAAAR